MKVLHTTFLTVLMAMGATSAWAQYGLYGSPEILNPLHVNQAARASSSAVLSGYAEMPNYASPAASYARPLGQMAAGGSGIPQPPAAPAGAGKAAPSVVDAMINEPAGNSGNGSGPLTRAVSHFERALMSGGGCDDCGEGGCGGCGDCCADPCCPWYAGVAFLAMGRDNGNRVWTSYEDGNAANQRTHTQDIHMDWGFGGEVTVGRHFCGPCGGAWAVEGTYWGLEPFVGSVSTTDPSGLATPLQFGGGAPDGVFFGSVAPANYVDLWFGNAAAEHRLSRRNEIHNVEINFLSSPLGSGYRWDVNWLAGVRFFRFEEQLTFASLRNGGTWGVGADEAYLRDQIVNSLIGFQIGCDVARHWGARWEVFASPRIGIYNNHIRHNFDVFRGDGVAAIENVYGATYPIVSSKDALSFLTELDLGVRWKFARRWAATVGYRIVLATGIGLSDNQIPAYILDTPEIANIDINGSLLLHGGFAGLEYNF